jgi:hypothetical protein
MPSGVRSISKCRFGAPAFVSFPHFYEADPSYLQNINGLSPEQDLHEFYVAVEPVSCMASSSFSILSRLCAYPIVMDCSSCYVVCLLSLRRLEL